MLEPISLSRQNCEEPRSRRSRLHSPFGRALGAASGPSVAQSNSAAAGEGLAEGAGADGGVPAPAASSWPGAKQSLAGRRRHVVLSNPHPQETLEAEPEQVGRVIANAMAGHTGLLLRMVFEMVKGNPDTGEGVKRSMTHGLPDLIAYLGEQMTMGRLRRMHPIVALQLLPVPSSCI